PRRRRRHRHRDVLADHARLPARATHHGRDPPGARPGAGSARPHAPARVGAQMDAEHDPGGCMVIRPDDRDATVIRDDESLIDVFASLSPAFERLRNPAMRKVMARLVTVEQVARMAGIDAQQLVDRLNAHRGGASHAASDATTSAGDGDMKVRADASPTATRRSAASPPAEAPSDPVSSRAEPPALAAIPAERRIVLVVREDLRAGNEPFRAIMAA